MVDLACSHQPLEVYYLEHSIGYIIAYTFDVTNRDATLEYDPQFYHLHYTGLGLTPLKTYPIIPIGESLESSNFKWKKHIRRTLRDKFKLKTKHVLKIKFLNTVNTYIHNYVIVIKRQLPLEQIHWHRQISFFKIPTKWCSPQSDEEHSLHQAKVLRAVLRTAKNVKTMCIRGDTPFQPTLVEFGSVLSCVQNIYKNALATTEIP